MWLAGFLTAAILAALFPFAVQWVIESKIRDGIRRFENRTGLSVSVGQIEFERMNRVVLHQLDVSGDSLKRIANADSGGIPFGMADSLLLFSSDRTAIHLNLWRAFSREAISGIISDTVRINLNWDTSGFNFSPFANLFRGRDTTTQHTMSDSLKKSKMIYKTSYFDRFIPDYFPDLSVRHLTMRFINAYPEFIPKRKKYRIKRDVMTFQNGICSLTKIQPDQSQFELKGLLVSELGQTQALISGQLNYTTKQVMVNTLLDRSFKLPFFSRWLDMDLALKGMDLMLDEAISDSAADHVDLQLLLHDIALTSEAVATKKIQGLDIGARLKMDIEPDHIRIHPQSRIDVGQIRVFLSGTIRQPDRQPDFDMVFTLDTIPLQEFFASVPPVFMTKLEGIRVQGKMSYTLGLRLSMARPDSVRIEPEIGLSRDFRVISLGDSIDMKKYRGDFMHVVVTEYGSDSTFWVGKDNPYYTPYDSIPQHLVWAVLLSEDGSFFRNDGFNVLQIEKSIAENLKRKKFARGASTVSMQFVKNIFLSREKTLSRKFQELILTWLIGKNRMLDEKKDKETHKKRLLEIYLNVIEWGPDVYGVGRASEFYFKKRPSALTVRESAFLATIIPNPKKYERYFYRGQLRKSKKNYMDMLARKMVAQQIIGHSEAVDATDSPLIITGDALPWVYHTSYGDSTGPVYEDDLSFE